MRLTATEQENLESWYRRIKRAEVMRDKMESTGYNLTRIQHTSGLTPSEAKGMLSDLQSWEIFLGIGRKHKK